MARASGSVSAARWLLGVTASVVLSFVLATGISQFMERQIADRAHQIITNAMPSIQMLSTARGELRSLSQDLDRYARASALEQSALATRIAALRESIAVSVSAYSALPFFPDEPRLYQRVKRDMDVLETGIGQYMTRADPALLAMLHQQIDEFDDALQRVNTFDAAQGQRLGYEIERIRGQTRAATVLLDLVSVALAIVAAILAIRQLRRAARQEDAERRVRELREAELTSQNEALGEFAGRIAHDILSPLSAASISLDVVRETTPHPIAARALDAGSAAIRRVHTLVEGLLNFSRAGGRPEPGMSAPLGPVLSDVLADLRGDAEHRGITLEVGEVPDASAVACSTGVLTSLVSNLVKNALKYMGNVSEKRVSVRVRDAGARWRIEVEDTGPGIPLEQQQRIFEPYTQLQRGSTGIGLGLATVDRLVRAHDGALGVVSPPPSGIGSLFWFELPKRLPATAAEPVPSLVVAEERAGA